MAASVRNATLDDFETVYQYIIELQGKVFDRSLMKSLYQQNLANPNNIYLLAVDGQAPIGYLSCHIQTLLHHAGKIAEVQEMYIVPEKRSLGVGKLLMNVVKEKVKEKGALQLEVTTRAIREKAIEFYRREHFEDSHKKLVHYFRDPS